MPVKKQGLQVSQVIQHMNPTKPIINKQIEQKTREKNGV